MTSEDHHHQQQPPSEAATSTATATATALDAHQNSGDHYDHSKKQQLTQQQQQNQQVPMRVGNPEELYPPANTNTMNTNTNRPTRSNSIGNGSSNGSSIGSSNGIIPLQVEEQDIDALLADELNQMSKEERERTYEEIHGVQARVVETPELIYWKLQEMERALATIPMSDKQAYLQAAQQDPAYVAQTSFRVTFLRCTSFDAVAAAHKCVAFLQGKLDLFGPHTLCRSLRLSDLDKDDMACLKSGAYQLLSRRDSTGRAAIVDFHLILPKCYKYPRNLLRTLAYLQLVAAEDEETQRRGLIGIVYYVGPFRGEFNHPLNQQVSKSVKWFPLRLTGYHICFDAPRLRAWKPLAILLMGRKLRARVRFHDGTHTECRYSLMTFGVPVDVLPITYQGEVKTTHHFKWMTRRQIKDDAVARGGANITAPVTTTGSSSSTTTFHGVDLPGGNDVLLRRGRVFHNHPGNVRMRDCIDGMQHRYAEASIKEKGQIAREIVTQIQSEGGRFLECDDTQHGWWSVVSDKEAHKRVGKAIRSMRNSLRHRHRQQQQHDVEGVGSGFVQTNDPMKD